MMMIYDDDEPTWPIIQIRGNPLKYFVAPLGNSWEGRRRSLVLGGGKGVGFALLKSVPHCTCATEWPILINPDFHSAPSPGKYQTFLNKSMASYCSRLSRIM